MMARIFAVTTVVCTIMTAACGGGSRSMPAGSSGAGGFCSTGTRLVLFYPPAGSLVLASTRKIYVASTFPLLNAASLVTVSKRPGSNEKSPARPLEGPVNPPTPSPTPSPIPTPTPNGATLTVANPNATPTPFPTPPFTAVYYVAGVFHLKPKTMYGVDIAIPGTGCIDKPIRGAFFSTRRRL